MAPEDGMVALYRSLMNALVHLRTPFFSRLRSFS